MEAYQLRVVGERDALDEKVTNLSEFLDDEFKMGQISDVDQSLLRTQLIYMRDYLYILNERIKRFDDV